MSIDAAVIAAVGATTAIFRRNGEPDREVSGLLQISDERPQDGEVEVALSGAFFSIPGSELGVEPLRDDVLVVDGSEHRIKDWETDELQMYFLHLEANE